MAHSDLHKCLFCGALFQADPRNARHQKYCSEPACRKVSKAASQRAWLAKPENQDYFRGPENVARVQSWRAGHPKYWRRAQTERRQTPATPVTSVTLQDVCPAQAIEITEVSQVVLQPALQDILFDQPAVLIGFIAQFTGSALQDDIARSTRRLLELEQDILAGRAGDDHQICALSRAGAADPRAVQLGGSPPCERRSKSAYIWRSVFAWPEKCFIEIATTSPGAGSRAGCGLLQPGEAHP